MRIELRGPLGKLYDVERSSEVVYNTKKKTDDVKAFEDDVAPETTTQTLQEPSEEKLELEQAPTLQEPKLQNVEYSQPGVDNPEIAKDLPSGLE